MTQQYAKIGEYTPVEPWCLCGPIPGQFRWQKGLIGTGLPLVATQLAKMLYSPNMIVFVKPGRPMPTPEISHIDHGQRLTYGSW